MTKTLIAAVALLAIGAGAASAQNMTKPDWHTAFGSVGSTPVQPNYNAAWHTAFGSVMKSTAPATMQATASPPVKG